MDRKTLIGILVLSFFTSSVIYLFLNFGLNASEPINIPNMDMTSWEQLTTNQKSDYFTNNPNSLKTVTGLEKVKFQLTYQFGYHLPKFLMLFLIILVSSYIASLITIKYNKAKHHQDC